MDETPALAFRGAYEAGTAPWVIGEPQPAIVDLERRGLIGGRVLDVGCGGGEHTILLTRLGYDVLGIDFAPHGIELARRNAAAKGVDARFEVADAMNLGAEPRYDTIVDSALFHIFDDTDSARYVNSLHAACPPGALVHVLALSDAGRGFGPQVSETVVREAFGDGWRLGSVGHHRVSRRLGEARAEALGLPVGSRVDEPAWLARARRL